MLKEKVWELLLLLWNVVSVRLHGIECAVLCSQSARTFSCQDHVRLDVAGRCQSQCCIGLNGLPLSSANSSSVPNSF